MKTRRRLLALVMLILLLPGILPVQTWSAEFTDVTEDEAYLAAVDVLAASALLSGIKVEDFQSGNKDVRNQAGKLIAYLLLGDKAARWMDMQDWYKIEDSETWWGKYSGCFSGLRYLEDGYSMMRMILRSLGYGTGEDAFADLPWNLGGNANQFYKAARTAIYFGTLPVTGPTIGAGTNRYVFVEDKDIDRSLRYYNYGNAVYPQNVTILSRVVEGQNTGTAYPAGLKIVQSALKKVAEWKAGLTMVTADAAFRTSAEQANALANSGTEELLLTTRTEDGAVTVLFTHEGGTPSEDMEVEIVLPAQGGLRPNVLICQDGQPLANTVIDIAANGYSAKARIPMGKETVFTLIEQKEIPQSGNYWDIYLKTREDAGAEGVAGDQSGSSATPLVWVFLGREENDSSELTEDEARLALVVAYQTANGATFFDPLSNPIYARNPDPMGMKKWIYINESSGIVYFEEDLEGGGDLEGVGGEGQYIN